MKVRQLFLILAMVAAYSCSSPLEKSVLEPLTSKELDKVAGKDISFLATYSIVEEKSNYIHSTQDSSRWRGITYQRLHNYLKTIESAELNSPLFAQLREKWENLYDSYNVQVDTILHKWNDYIIKNTPDSLLALSFEGVEIEKIRNAKKQIDTLVKAKLKFKALSFPVDSLSLTYRFEPYSDTSCLNHITHKKRIRDSVVIKVFPNLVPQLKTALAINDTSLTFAYEIHSLYANGKCYNVDTLKSHLPKSVIQFIDAERSSLESQIFDESYFRERIIRELVDPSFISQSAYIKVNAEDYYKEIDSLVFSYTNLQ
ncbi:MAG: hypothetical protein IIX41_04065 [Bacteroidales bacterium]|nr:hypothetical protein [Bacteroidales bacterium]